MCSPHVAEILYLQKLFFSSQMLHLPPTAPGSACAPLLLVLDAAGEATLPSGSTEHGQGIPAGSQGSSVCLKMFDLKHSNHVDASKDPVPVEAQGCHQSQGAERSLPYSLDQV